MNTKGVGDAVQRPRPWNYHKKHIISLKIIMRNEDFQENQTRKKNNGIAKKMDIGIRQEAAGNSKYPKVLGFFLCAMLFALCLRAEAQQTGKVARIGFLDNTTASGSLVRLEAFWQEIRKLGWIEGKNIAIEYRFAEGKNERLPELVADLVRLKVDVIVGTTTATVSAAKRSGTSIPIVMTNVTDPVDAGLIASLARPGGNVTGVAGLSSELNTKRLEILKDAVPKVARVGVLRGGQPA